MTVDPGHDGLLREDLERARKVQKREGHRRNGSTSEEHGPRLAAIPTYPQEAFPFDFEATKLPPALVGGAALAAAACAIGGKAKLIVAPGWSVRAHVWVPLIAPRGAGKTPSQDLGFGPLRRWDEGDVIPLRTNDMTMESLARTLIEQPALAIDVDELAQPLRGLGEYKRGKGGDQGRFLALWSGAPWRLTRVGGAKKAENAVDLRIPSPSVTICGGLQPRLHYLLGGEEDGLRPRWLPHLADFPEDDELPEEDLRIAKWDLKLGQLIQQRERERTWRLSPDAREIFSERRKQWKAQARSTEETASTSAALVKADVHLAKAALVLAELERPGEGGEVPEQSIENAIEIVDFTLDGWRALPEQGSLSLSFRDDKLNRACERLVDWLEEHRDPKTKRGRATRRDLLRSGVAGVRSAKDLDVLLAHFKQMHPGCVEQEASSGGRPPTVIWAPLRRGGDIR